MTICQRLIKRAFDIFFSSLGICLVWPLMFLIAVAVRCSSPGPIIFRQLRVGKRGRLFNFYKFRTMYADHNSASTVTVSGDGRITPVGAFLRRWKLDELPQLWNVLKGDMSFVGPRPDVPGFADRLAGDDRVVLSVRPGITGPAALKYRHEEELLAVQADPEKYNREVIYPDKVRINREYIENYSFFADIRYILMTVFPFDKTYHG